MVRSYPLPTSLLTAIVSLAFLVSLNACSKGGKVRLELEPLNEDKAVELLERSAQDPERSAALVSRVEAQGGSGINYSRFWQRVRVTNVMSRLPEATQQRLLSLHRQSCTETDFNEFARLVASLDRQHQDFILGEFRRCQTALTPERTVDFLLRILVSPPPQAANPTRPIPDPVAERRRLDALQLEPWAALPEAIEKEPNPELRHTLISRFLSEEILRAPRQNWNLVACFLNGTDLEYIQRELKRRELESVAQGLILANQTDCQN